jgi:hypothetical protein
MQGDSPTSQEYAMRAIKWLAGMVLAWVLGGLPSCATMGGGGMKYLVDPPAILSDRIA